MLWGVGDRAMGDWKKRGLEMYTRQEKR